MHYTSLTRKLLKDILYRERKNSEYISEEKVRETRKGYKKIFNSNEAKRLIKTFPHAEEAIDILLEKITI